MNRARGMKKHMEWYLFGLLGLFAFFLCFRSGERGYFAFDQSFIFDGAYRIVSGQIPYKDFVIPFGPIVFLVQALFFKIVGISYFSYIFSGSLMNVAGAVSSVIILKKLMPDKKLLPWSGGFVTAIWYCPFSGTLYTEQTAFFFIFLNLTAMFMSLYDDRGRSVRTDMLTLILGVFASLGFFTKQNAGLIAFPLYFALFVCIYMGRIRLLLRRIFIFLCGSIASTVCLFLWIWKYSDLRNFIKHVFVVPYAMGTSRLGADWGVLIKGSNIVQYVLFISLVVAGFVLFLYLYQYKKVKGAWRNVFMGSVLSIGLISYQFIFNATANKYPENGFPFIGFILAITSYLILFMYDVRNELPGFDKGKVVDGIKLRKAIVLTTLVMFIGISSYGIHLALSRRILYIINAEFNDPLPIDKVKNLRWAEPTWLVTPSVLARRAKPHKELRVRESDILGLYEYLRKKDRNFFIFPDFTIFYALLDKVSPQPVLWFHRGLTYPKEYDESIDRWIVESLKKNEVRIVVKETTSWKHTGSTLAGLPLMAEYIRNNFRRVKNIGIFEIHEKI